MNVQRYKTNLNCGSCVAAVTPYLDGDKSIKRWSVDTVDPNKILTIESDGVTLETVQRLVSSAGFQVLGEVQQSPPETTAKRPESTTNESRWNTYYPLFLVFAFLIGMVGLFEWQAGSFAWQRAMNSFMGGFFVVFSFFKLLDPRGFVDAFRSYDVLARRWSAYGYAYPFIELLLGIAYLAHFQPLATNLATVTVMSAGLFGVTQALLAKRKIQCACLGTVFKLPMSSVTFFEDALMAGMALFMLANLSLH